MENFEAPFRLLTIYERLHNERLPENCDIDLQSFRQEDERKMFPFISYDTARIVVTNGDLSVFVYGRIQEGVFHYHVLGYRLDNEPFGEQFFADIGKSDAVVANVVERFV